MPPADPLPPVEPEAAVQRAATFEISVGVATLFLATIAVNLQMPLYRAYAEAAGFGYALTTLVFSAYVAGLLPTLLLFGGLSDRVGRRAAMVTGLGSSFTATALMIWSPGIQLLFVSRVLQGIGVGLSVGAASAFLGETMDTPRTASTAGPQQAATRSVQLVTAATSLGFGGGALFTGSILLFGATREPWSYWAVALATGICLVLLPKVRQNPPLGGSLLRLPHFAPNSLSAGISIATAWAVTGVVISLVPGQLAAHGLSTWAGHALFMVNATGAALQTFARKLSIRSSLYVGFLLLPLGYFCLLLGASSGSLGLVLGGGALAGAACYGFTYLGGLRLVSACAPTHRARAVSGYFLLAYLGFGIPSILLGWLADKLGLEPVLLAFGAVIVCTCAALALWTSRHTTASASAS